MKITKCDCGCPVFIAKPIGGYCVMCTDNGKYNHRSGPTRKTKKGAVAAWNEMMRDERGRKANADT